MPNFIDYPSLDAVLSAFAMRRRAPSSQRPLPPTESRDNMHTEHWAYEPDQPLTEADLRLLHDKGHDPHPERPEHLRPVHTDTDADAGESS